MHLNPLVTDLTMILLARTASFVLFKLLRIPVILSYILAGVVVGPQFSYFPTVVSTQGLQAWSELGIIIIFFLVGLEFNFKKLLYSGKQLIITALLEVVATFLVCSSLSFLVGFESTQSFIIGAMGAISSTMILVKNHREMDLDNSDMSKYCKGILITEDIIAIFVLIILTSLVGNETFSTRLIWETAAKIIVFMFLSFTILARILHFVFARMKNYITDEFLTISILGLCLTMVYVANRLELSSALGSFVMGGIFSGQHYSPRIAELMRPFSDLFMAIFFVAVGNYLELKVVHTHLGLIIVLSLFIFMTKSSVIYFITKKSELDRKQAMLAAFSMAQIGEFSFLMAMIALEQRILPQGLYSVIIMVSLITTVMSIVALKYSPQLFFKNDATHSPAQSV